MKTTSSRYKIRRPGAMAPYVLTRDAKYVAPVKWKPEVTASKHETITFGSDIEANQFANTIGLTIYEVVQL